MEKALKLAGFVVAINLLPIQFLSTPIGEEFTNQELMSYTNFKVAKLLYAEIKQYNWLK